MTLFILGKNDEINTVTFPQVSMPESISHVNLISVLELFHFSIFSILKIYTT